jgi:hypothetical protein
MKMYVYNIRLELHLEIEQRHVLNSLHRNPKEIGCFPIQAHAAATV